MFAVTLNKKEERKMKTLKIAEIVEVAVSLGVIALIVTVSTSNLFI